MQWLPGKDNVIADALSCAPVFPPDVTEEDRTEEDNINKTTVEKDMQLQPLLQAARCDNPTNIGIVRCTVSVATIVVVSAGVDI